MLYNKKSMERHLYSSSSSSSSPSSPPTAASPSPYALHGYVNRHLESSPPTAARSSTLPGSISLMDKSLKSNFESSTLKPPRVPSSIISSSDLSQSLPETSQSPSSTYSVAFFHWFCSFPSSIHSSNLTSSPSKSYTTNLMPTHLSPRSPSTFSFTAVLSEYPP